MTVKDAGITAAAVASSPSLIKKTLESGTQWWVLSFEETAWLKQSSPSSHVSFPHCPGSDGSLMLAMSYFSQRISGVHLYH